MKISLNWIKEYVNLADIDHNQLLNKFTLSIAEIEDVTEMGKNLTGVVSAKIEEVNDHPTSKKLHLLKVNAGQYGTYSVVCGAPNVAVGMVVPFATVGANVNGLRIQAAVVGGYESAGMCCSEKELGISEDDSGLMVLPHDTQLGVDIKKLYQIDDVVFEVDNKSLTNRPDLWGHYGIAREIAALVGRPLNQMPVKELQKGNDLNITTKSQHAYRYSALTVDNVTKHVSPKNMQIRLHYTGYRPINLLTDLTNYVMCEVGQPMHAFDGDLVKDVKVYDLKHDCEFVTLDGKKRVLGKDTMVIANHADEIFAVAGVMGGEKSGISDTTNKLFLESANFDATVVRKTANAIGLRSESSTRFEKTLDPEMTVQAIKRYVYLLQQADAGVRVTSDLNDVYNKKYPNIVVNISKEFIDGYIGQDLGQELILDILNRLEFKVVVSDGGNYEVTVPSFRATKDISQGCDIVEEITRIYGYDNLIATPTLQKIVPVTTNRFTDLEYRTKHLLATKFNLNEVHSNLWYVTESNKELGIEPYSVIKLVNALQKENSDIRQTIIPSLLKFVNENKTSYNNMGLFEIGKVADSIGTDGNVIELAKLGIVRYSKSASEAELLYEVKHMIEYLVEYEINHNLEVVKKQNNLPYYHPTNNYEFFVNGHSIGEIAVLHPTIKNNITKNCSVVVAEINFTQLCAFTQNNVRYKKTTKYPVTEFDFSFITGKDVLFAELKTVAELLKSQTQLEYSFDYVGNFKENETQKSQTIKFKVWSNDKTLVGAELNEFYDLVVNTFKTNGYELKGNA